MLIHLKSLVLCVALALLVTDCSAQCTYGDYDLAQIPEAELDIDQEYNNQPATPYTWVVNLCQPVSHPPDGVPECVAKNGGAVLPGFITEYSSSHCQTSWGQLTSATAGDNAVVLTFGESKDSNNPGWTATVALVCGPTVALTPTNNVIVTGNDLTKLAFAFAFSSSAVCTGGYAPPGGPATSACGGGCAFVIIVFVGAFLYAAGTVVFYYFREGKRGMELIPHPHFWKEFAEDVKTGVVFSVNKVRALVCKTGPEAAGGGSGYQQV